MRMRPFVAVLGFAILGQPLGADAQVDTPAASTCAPTGTMFMRTTLYFGLARPAGTVSEREWKTFVRDQVTTRFPRGFTMWEALGQWRGPDGRVSRERARVLLIVHQSSVGVRDAIAALVETWKRTFQQESVLWETATVCAAF